MAQFINQVKLSKHGKLGPPHVYEEIPELVSYKNKLRNTMRIVCISDTHSRQKNIQWKFPKGDVIVHAGDFSFGGHKNEIEDFVNWFSKLPYK